MLLLAGKVGIVTGASRGIGRAIAVAAAEAGATVLACARTQEGLEETAALVTSSAGTVLPKLCDVSIEREIEGVVHDARDMRGGIDFLVNNAGMLSNAGLLEVTAEEWDDIAAVNVLGPLLASKHAVRAMIDHGRGGSIVNIGSTVSFAGVASQVAYCMSKHAILGLTRAVAADASLSTAGIRVNCVCPGEILTQMTEQSLPASGNPASAQAELAHANPAGRLGMPEEVADLVVFLCSDRASLIHGAAILADNGQTARLM